MKTLVRLNEKIVQAVPSEELPPEVAASVVGLTPTFRQLFNRLAILAKAKDADDALASYEIGLKIRSAGGDTCEVEEAEFRVLKSRARENVLGWNISEQAQVLKLLDEIETSGNKKPS